MVNVIRRFTPRGSVVDEGALKQFQKQWATYQKLVDNDAMSHKAGSRVLHETLTAEFAGPFAFLDIACGDASTMKAVLSGTTVVHYHGIDLSEPALDLAARNLEGVPFEVELEQRDFVEAMSGRPEPADAAWCGFSIHHLQSDEKVRFLREVRNATARFFMIYEPTCLEGESRDGYLDRFIRVNRPAWTFFTPVEWKQIEDHVVTCDFPETPAGWLDIGRQAGFSAGRQLFANPTGFYGLYRFDH